MTEDEMVGWYHQFNGHEFEQAPGDSEGQGSLAYCSLWGCKESDRIITTATVYQVLGVHQRMKRTKTSRGPQAARVAIPPPPPQPPPWPWLHSTSGSLILPVPCLEHPCPHLFCFNSLMLPSDFLSQSSLSTSPAWSGPLCTHL